MKRSRMFNYAWHVDEDEKNVTVIRVYGLNESNENVCVRINDFTPYVYIELPDIPDQIETIATKVGDIINNLLMKQKPLKKCLIYRYKLYYAHLDKNGKRKKFPYLFCSFSHPSDIRSLTYKLKKPVNIRGMEVTLKIHEHNASPILQFVSQTKVPTAGWMEFAGRKILRDEQKTLCHHEYVVPWKNIKPVALELVAKPLIMGFDIEVNSSNPSRMPVANKPKDKVFQISCILSRQGEPPEKYIKYLLTLGKPDLTMLQGVNVISYDSEEELLIGFTHFINKHNPNVLVGYNIMGFDIPYMIDRAKGHAGAGFADFDQMGFLKDAHAQERTISWSSSAYKNQTFQFLDAEGRLFVDLLPLIKRDYKFNNYKLKTVASFFLKGFTKDDMEVQEIFKSYRLGMVEGSKKGARALARCGAYCVKDSLLMNMLFDNLQTWIGLCEMATVCVVPVFYLYTQGQQIKVFSQIYKNCTHEGITVEKDGYIPKDDEHYTGAMVFPPVPGVYDNVVPCDFSSLYPSTIIAYNLDYSTLVEDEKIPDSMCHIIEWCDHVGCKDDPKVIRKVELTEYILNEQKEIKKLRDGKKGKKGEVLEEQKREIDKRVKALKPYTEERTELNKSKSKYIMCCKRKFRWLKEPLGVLPTLLKNLLDARANTKNEMKGIQKQLTAPNLSKEEKSRLETLYVVLDKRQLAYKVSANSAYGATGVQRGYLPMMPIAMSTTAMGRKNITIVAETIPKKFKGQLVYGDYRVVLNRRH